jgi:hypothetical protein
MEYGSVGATVLRYFNPARSPFYFVVAAGTFSLVISCQNIEKPFWYFVATPIYVSLTIALVFAFIVKSNISAQEHEEQLVFARSTGISAALLALSLTTSLMGHQLMPFWIVFAVTVLQALIFFLYDLLRSQSYEGTEKNFVQITLITTTLLVGVCDCAYSFATKPAPEANRFLFSGAGLMLLWSACACFWLAHFVKISGAGIPTNKAV